MPIDVRLLFELFSCELDVAVGALPSQLPELDRFSGDFSNVGFEFFAGQHFSEKYVYSGHVSVGVGVFLMSPGGSGLGGNLAFRGFG